MSTFAELRRVIPSHLSPTQGAALRLLLSNIDDAQLVPYGMSAEGLEHLLQDPAIELQTALLYQIERLDQRTSGMYYPLSLLDDVLDLGDKLALIQQVMMTASSVIRDTGSPDPRLIEVKPSPALTMAFVTYDVLDGDGEPAGRGSVFLRRRDLKPEVAAWLLFHLVDAKVFPEPPDDQGA